MRPKEFKQRTEIFVHKWIRAKSMLCYYEKKNTSFSIFIFIWKRKETFLNVTAENKIPCNKQHNRFSWRLVAKCLLLFLETIVFVQNFEIEKGILDKRIFEMKIRKIFPTPI